MNLSFSLMVIVVALTLVVSPGHAAQASDARVDNLMQRDLNDDGVLTEDEAPPGMFSLLDSNNDGQADRAELVALMARISKPFSWVNPPTAERTHPRLAHATFLSPSMDINVGYNIYLPPGYEDASNANRRYPVVYYLHGGRPGNESLSVGLASPIHGAVKSGAVRPIIFVWVNGGKVSHYNYQDSNGEDVFVKELIPYIDRTYRTVAHRGGRALQGFSQGGRGTTRIMFKYPQLFASAAPGGPGYAVEKLVYENDGVEQDTRLGENAPALDFGKGNDAFSRARDYAKQPFEPPLKVMVWVGNKGFNYEATLEYLGFLYGLGIRVERMVAPGVDHNPTAFYAARGVELLQFHDRHWRNID